VPGQNARATGEWTRYIRTGLAVGSVGLALLAPHSTLAEAASPRQISWDDLTVKIQFDDPFESLTQEQLMKLSIYARVKAMLEHVPDKVSEGMSKEADEAAAWLKGEGVDIAALLAKREEIKTLRKARATATNPELNGKQLRMPGYALPLEYDGKKVTEFLLVPWVGACIHTPPPPPNQIVLVDLAGGYEVKSRFEPVWVTGTMAIGDMSKNLYLVDGKADISIGYSIKNAQAERYESMAGKPVPRRGKADHN
jgi:hypothetical protein